MALRPVGQGLGLASAGFDIWETNSEVKSQFVIRDNQISGSGPAAMYLGVTGLGDSGLMVKGNNVQGWKVDSAPCGADCQGLPLAPIWLGIETSGNLRTNVFDETDRPETPAYDGANILIGVNARSAHMGQAIRDAMQRRIEVKKQFMNKRPF